ncbi:uncharacterized protein L203_100171 [Cryptococcus depauperatus CBS 7841]|uniref:Uncharacterized protein n=1 Tax=Cryptococcus depauperatus CBS 7841 TaxID=1295531 RepID=A0A1E3IZH8_9TREE|nr:hypothetical protein L203_00168 [Cryptococcus depauperatus CBS 7841]
MLAQLIVALFAAPADPVNHNASSFNMTLGCSAAYIISTLNSAVLSVASNKTSTTVDNGTVDSDSDGSNHSGRATFYTVTGESGACG